jgi:hypothetical protein
MSLTAFFRFVQIFTAEAPHRYDPERLREQDHAVAFNEMAFTTWRLPLRNPVCPRAGHAAFYLENGRSSGFHGNARRSRPNLER